jgi:hypothetical protein
MTFTTLAGRAGLAASAATIVVAAGLGSAVAATGGTSATSHTMRFISTQIKDVMANDVDVATDKNSWKGKTVGYDVTSCTISLQTHVATCKVALARAEGLLYANAKVNLDTGKGNGKVTGGSGGFHGATGTVTIAPGPSQDTNKITINYQV